ncbi:TetR/AcrR family transcriptional regulator [Nocardia sp. A7]|uniref:TetR/AcrR family transcriptional regulator n=1 Tax=Nocardia sp. A7 TaxID=2789274 RepID=UPI00397D5842
MATTPASTSGRTPTRRPADRKQQIIVAASKLFCERGFHNVSVAEVAAAVGITAASLYRHFRNKLDLLSTVVHVAVDDVGRLAAESSDLDDLLRRSASGCLERRTSALLWQREARHLSEADRLDQRAKLIRAGTLIGGLIQAQRPDLDDEDAELLAWGMTALFGSVALHRVSLPRKRFEEQLIELATSLTRCELGDRPAPGAEPHRKVPVTSSRENLLNEAIRLFDERGFQSVSTDEIGQASGTSGPNIYKHFPSKTDLLVAAVVRAGEQRRSSTMNALARAHSAAESLELLLRSYIDFAVDHHHLLGVLIGELDQLPDKERRAAKQTQREYLALWVDHLAPVLPDNDPAVNKIKVHAVLSIIDNIVRTGHVGRRPDVAERLVEMCTAVLHPAQTE